MNSPNNFFSKIFILLLFYYVFGGMGAAGFWRLDAAAELSDWAHQHQYESRKWWAKSRIPGPGCPADGYKMVLCLCPAKAAHNCYPIRSLLAGGPRNSNLCPHQSWKMSMARFMSTAIPKNVHAEVRVTAIYIHNNSEKCPWRCPSNSNLCPQQSRKMSMPRSK